MPSNKGTKDSSNESKQASTTTSKSGTNNGKTNSDNVSTNLVADDNQQTITNDNSTSVNNSTIVRNDTITSISQVDVIAELKTLSIQFNNQLKENAEITKSFQLQMSQITNILVGLSNQVASMSNSNLSSGPALHIIKPIVTNPIGMTIDPNVSSTINQGSTNTSNLVIDSATITSNMVPEVKAPSYIVENSNSDMSPSKFINQNNVNQSINPAITATNKSVPVTAVNMTSVRHSPGNVQSNNTNQSSALKYGDNNHNDKTKSLKSNGYGRGHNVFNNNYTSRTLIQHAGLGAQYSTRNAISKLGLQHAPIDRGRCINIYINWNRIQEGVSVG
jgi:hypothetical protein